MHNNNLQNLLNIHGTAQKPSNTTRTKTPLYKKKSTKTFLLFFKFFNSVLYINNILIMFNFNLFYFMNHSYKYVNVKKNNMTNNYFINTNKNTNINLLGLVKKKKLKKIKTLHKYRHVFVKSFSYYVSKMLKKSCKMIIKFNFFKLLKI